jgi:hypothetical protein
MMGGVPRYQYDRQARDACVEHSTTPEDSSEPNVLQKLVEEEHSHDRRAGVHEPQLTDEFGLEVEHVRVEVEHRSRD